jgi:glutathione S-transferase
VIHRGLAVWESLAIAEYLNDVKPEALLWPSSQAARAHARAISAEMHAGFAELRKNMPMNIRASYPGKGMTPAVRADIERITGLWRDCRKRFGGAFPKDDGFLFGTFGAADAMFAPVVNRLHVYDVPVRKATRAYMDVMLALPSYQQWLEEAAAEPWVHAPYEL